MGKARTDPIEEKDPGVYMQGLTCHGNAPALATAVILKIKWAPF